MTKSNMVTVERQVAASASELMGLGLALNRHTLSSSALVCSLICPGFAGAIRRGSLSTIISKSTSFSDSVDMSFSKQKAYSPGVLAVRT